MELLTVEEAAAILKLSPFTVREWLKEGKLPGIRLGDSKVAPWRIHKDDLEAYLSKQPHTRETQP